MVVVVAVGVGDADEVEPVFCHVLAIGGGGDEAVDEFCSSFGRGVVEVGFDFFARGGESGEVEGEATDEGAFVGFIFGCFLFCLDFGEDKIVDLRAGPAGIFYRRWCLLFCWDECPKIFVFSSLFDPFLQEDFFVGGKGFRMSIDWRHGVFFVDDSLPSLGGFEGVWDDSGDAVFFCVSAFWSV